ncbi:GyrI-like domain-containing protein [uncultured Sneathiella sp.]|uniref:GyrI-like domain-containing protein n=1 Tax=uncultured Sneathiella sp. TaxID=879315 RepID=UPI0025924890|nr:GyrI-like domain-containing protein [uncultured Sneathiella sp.]
MSTIQPARFVDRDAFFLAGLQRAHFHASAPDSIPAQWQDFVLHLPLENEAAHATYGVIIKADDAGDTLDYMTGIEVTGKGPLPAELGLLELAPARYAVFLHNGSVAGVPTTMQAIFTDWLPQSGSVRAERPFFERYGDRFNPETGEGEIELWIPIKD